MNLVDSSGWLEYFAGGKNCEFFSAAIQDTENLIVSTINIYEVFKIVLQQRDENSALQAIALMEQAAVTDVDSSIALSAARVKLPAASRGASLAQLKFKLRRPLLQISMMLDIFLNHITSHTVSHRPRKVPVFPKLPSPQSPLHRRELAEQLSGSVTFDDPNNLTNRSLRGKRHQNMNMLHCHLHLDNLKPILLTNFSYQLLRSFPYIPTFQYLLAILRTPDQMITRVVDRMTRSLDRHASVISQSAARAYNHKKSIHPRGKPRGILLSVC
jgi:uncharacterized protein with PIN domain